MSTIESQCVNCGHPFLVNFPESPEPPDGDDPDAERLAEAMDEAYTYEADYATDPTLPFTDDLEGFWRPFAAKVRAALRGDPPKEGAA